MFNKMNGYLYCVYSKDGIPNKYFTNEFLISYKSLRTILPNCHVCLYTNIKFKNTHGIDHVICDPNISQSHICKAHGLLKSPYKKTILLDTDTIFHRNCINDIFSVLNDFDFACCHGNQWNAGTIYPDFNTGLVGVKNNDFTKKEIKIWINEFTSTGTKSDQKHFRNIFIRNKHAFYVLPPYFMYRFEHMGTYPKQAVMSHVHTMKKIDITKTIIKRYKKTLEQKKN